MNLHPAAPYAGMTQTVVTQPSISKTLWCQGALSALIGAKSVSGAVSNALATDTGAHALERELLDGIDADREAEWWWQHSDFVLDGGGIATYIDKANHTVIRQRHERAMRSCSSRPSNCKS